MIRVRLPEPDPKGLGDLAGRVVDEAGRPVEGARVALIFVGEQGNGSAMSSDDRHQVITDAQGRYLLRAIPRAHPGGAAVKFGLAVTRGGFAGLDVFAEPGSGGFGPFGIPFRPGDGDSPQVLKDIRMEPGTALTGVVVGPDGSPAAGAWVSGGGYALRSQGTRTDEHGRFTFRDLPRGMASLTFEYGKLYAGGKYLADGSADGLKVQLRPLPIPAAPAAAPAPRRTLKIGEPAPEWSANGWTDGKPRALADLRGKVVFLDFWGDWCAPCLDALPSLERLRAKYEPRGVAFVSIHTPGGDPETIRKLFAFKKVALVSAVDEPRKPDDNSRNGATADRYGVGGYPTILLIDRDGKVAFPTDGAEFKAKVEEMKALGKSMGLDEATMTPDQFHGLFEAFFGREIERALERR